MVPVVLLCNNNQSVVYHIQTSRLAYIAMSWTAWVSMNCPCHRVTDPSLDRGVDFARGGAEWFVRKVSNATELVSLCLDQIRCHVSLPYAPRHLYPFSDHPPDSAYNLYWGGRRPFCRLV